MNNLSDMTDLSFTQTKRAMQSTPLSRVKGQYRPMWAIAATNNRKPKVLIDRVRDGKRSNPTVFMGC
ncbi:hypothetical protein [Pseudoalteromonas phage SL25]|nr:hypothetical protein [Pseudoalteromonas phage SL25]